MMRLLVPFGFVLVEAPLVGAALHDNPTFLSTFKPLRPAGVYHAEDETRDYQDWVWTCPKLAEDGRCTIYNDRPDMCRNFEPLSDGLCVHFQGAEAGDPTFDGELL
jgi:Fe-S-cluster containining protein